MENSKGDGASCLCDETAFVWPLSTININTKALCERAATFPGCCDPHILRIERQSRAPEALKWRVNRCPSQRWWYLILAW